VGPAELRIPDRLPPEVVDLEVTEINRSVQTSGPKTEKGKSSVTGNLVMDLGLLLPGRVFIRGRGLDAEWEGNLRVKGRLPEPSFTGSVSVKRGRYDFAGKRFVLKSGILTFDGAFPPSPRFEVVAEHKGPDIIARIKVSGTPASPKLMLESSPPLPSDEILSRILFGRNVNQISPVQALQLAAAVKALAGGGSSVFDVMDRTRQFLRVDRLDIKTSGDAKEGAALSIGKYLRDDVFVEIEQGMGPKSGKVSVEVEMTPNITIETEAGADAQGGVGLNWKWDY
jgi:translocation and assembly module TamB